MSTADNRSLSDTELRNLADNIRDWGRELGFQQVGITDIDLNTAGSRLAQWLDNDYQGEMTWMADHGDKRWRPARLLPGTLRVICARMDYLPPESNLIAVLRDRDQAYVSRYAVGRDYHKLVRKRLAVLAGKISASLPEEFADQVVQRPFVDSAPVMEKPLAEKAGLGWMGKHTLILHKEFGSWFFLGEIYTSLPLPVDTDTVENACGSCSACLNICPTKAFPAPYQLDARRCISYLTIEHKGSIPAELRPLIGNRVFGCDDCQVICPWNRFARPTGEADFAPRHGLDDSSLQTLFAWTAEDFDEKSAGSPIRRIGYERWQRNLAVGLGNATPSAETIRLLRQRLATASPLVAEHIRWAIDRQTGEGNPTGIRPFPRLK
ncbi:MAG: tRNA epoxyqueuosine(34) reductase QueG [Porticoccaceae bacterium]|nr:tRNA epoxyqueuosine(34) reductase QueG [Porticoccaceae bacterium]